MKNDEIERHFRELEGRAEMELLLDPEKRNKYLLLQKKRKVVEEEQRRLMIELHMYG